MPTADRRQFDVPEHILSQWQSLVDAMAELAGIPAGLIMRVVEGEIEVFAASQSAGNPYHVGDSEHWCGSGLYCETVIKTRRPLLVPDALADPDWAENPDVKLNMISYLGYPILYPDGKPFGTLCILDNQANAYSDAVRSLLAGFRDLIQSHLGLLELNAALGEENAGLQDYLDELEALRGMIPICAQCKKVKDSDGYWQAVENYLIKHPTADFTHGYCPDCLEQARADLRRLREEDSRSAAGTMNRQ